MEEMKRCRYCNAEINKAAKRCQFCNRWQKKSKIWIIILIVIIIIFSIFVIICNNKMKKRSEAKNKLLLRSEKDVYSYLEETYPDNEFIVKDVNRTSIFKSFSKQDYEQNIWRVYSKTIDKEFYVYNDYRI